MAQQEAGRALPTQMDLKAKFPHMCELTDRFGNTFYFGNAGDYWTAPYPTGADLDYWTQNRRIRNMEVREDDIFLAGFPKTGTHWHSEIIRMLMSRSARFEDAEQQGKMALVDHTAMSVLNEMKSPRFLGIHTPFRHFPRQALEKNVKIVYLDRNPKDVFVSYYNNAHNFKWPMHYPGTFEHLFHLMLETGLWNGDIFNYLMEWQDGIEANPDAQIYTSVFEEVKLDPIGGVLKLNEFLGTGCGKELCEEIATACSFKNMKTHKDGTASAADKQMFRSENSSWYRKGEIGDWKNWFTVAMNERFDAVFERKMKDYKRKYVFTVE